GGLHTSNGSSNRSLFSGGREDPVIHRLLPALHRIFPPYTPNRFSCVDRPSFHPPDRVTSLGRGGHTPISCDSVYPKPVPSLQTPFIRISVVSWCMESVSLHQFPNFCVSAESKAVGIRKSRMECRRNGCRLAPPRR